MSHTLKKIEPINRLLESRFGLRVEMAPFEHLFDVREHYEAKRKLYLQTLGESAALQNPEYAKAVLISEAIRLLLREIAPKRLKRRKQ